MLPSTCSSTAPAGGGRTQWRSTNMIFSSGSSSRDCTSTGRRCSWSATSAIRAERLADRTEANVATASTSVPPAVASEEIVAQSAIRPSGPGEGRRALLDERHSALDEVLRAPERVLKLGLEVELGVEIAVDEPVERALGGRVGTRGPGGQAFDQRLGLGHKAVVGVDPVDQPPLERLRGRDALPEQRHLEG